MNFDLAQNECPLGIRVYPSQSFFDHYNTNTPRTVTVSVVMVFAFTIFMFLLFDRLVERRQKILLSQAMKSTTILASLFPKNIRDRLMEEAEQKNREQKGDLMAPNHRLKSFLNADDKNKENIGLQPLADLFPHA